MRSWSQLLAVVAGGALSLALLATPSAAQNTGTVTGTVADATSGQTLESAQVFIPALNLGALSNAQGRFLILGVPAGTHEIRVELIGYGSATQQVTVTAGQPATVTFELASTALRLQELVVTGVAGETPRVKLPFTVEKVDFTDMPVPSPSADGLIAAKVAGVEVKKASGQPGEDAQIMLRGPSSIMESYTPLIIVDGVITDNTLADISSLDVESIEIIKGAAAASLYGSRAQNGVVQIRTRRGNNLRVDQSRITVRNELATQNIEGSIQLSKNHRYATDAAGNILDIDGNVIQSLTDDGVQPALNGNGPGTTFQDREYPSYFQRFDPLGQIFDPGEYFQSYVAAEGRTSSTNYRASFTYQDEAGIMGEFNDGFQLKGFRLNLDHEVRDNLNLSLSTYYSRSAQEDVAGGTFFSLTFTSPFVNLLARDTSTIGNPSCPPQGCLFISPDPLSNEQNPLYFLELRDLRDDRQRFLGSANVTWSPLSWFDLEATFSLDRSDFFETNITPPGLILENGISEGGLSKFQRYDNDINSSLTASINKAFGELTTRTRLRYLIEDGHREQFSVSGEDFAAIGVPTLDNTQGAFSASSYLNDVVAEGYFFITALDYKGKYVGDFLVRRDGSSLFGPDERWQTYYRGSGAWRLAQEGWWPFDDVNEFKLRYSIGTAGGRPRFEAQYETFSVSGGVIRPVALGNRKLKPERSTEQEVGLETVLFNKVSAGVIYAWNEIEDQLLRVSLPGFVGYSSQWQNAGALKSNTLEAYIETALIDRPDLTWQSRVNFDRTRQVISRLDISPRRQDWFYLREGEPLGTFYGHRWATSCADLPAGTDCSQFQVNDDGLLVWVGSGNSFRDGIANSLWDTRGEVSDRTYRWGIPIVSVDETGADVLRMGTTTPDFNLSLSNTLRWKSLSLYTLFDGQFGGDLYNQTRQWAYRENRSADQDQFGKPDDLKKTVTYYQTLYDTNSWSSWFVEEGTFVKLREASLRYTFDADMVERLFGSMGLDGLSLSVIGRNLKTWTDYSGYDPEVGGIINGQDDYQYPNFRSLAASLEIIF